MAASLTIATLALYTRLRSCGLSAHGPRTQRNQFTGKQQIPISDKDIIARHQNRKNNNSFSKKSKCSNNAIYPL